MHKKNRHRRDNLASIHSSRFKYNEIEWNLEPLKLASSITVYCDKHGKYITTLKQHLRSKHGGCDLCLIDSTKKSNTIPSDSFIKSTSSMTLKERRNAFIHNANITHSNFYDYSQVVYIDAKTQVEIICPLHGRFFQSPDHHINRQHKCRKCRNHKKSQSNTNNKKLLTLKDVINDFNRIHNNRYSYKKIIIYPQTTTDITITCPIHGDFVLKRRAHATGTGCNECKIDYKKQKFISYVSELYGNKYDYSNVTYVNATTPVKVGCPIHGSFFIEPSKHRMKIGCPDCTEHTTWNSNYETFLINATKHHGTFYDYRHVDYSSVRMPVKIICPIHGMFEQLPSTHYGSGCPICAGNISKPEIFIFNELNNVFDVVVKNDRSIIHPKELDIYIPSSNLAIEYCGIYWHSEQFKQNKNYHQEKYKLCYDKNIRLLTVFSDEWLSSPDKIMKKILNIAKSSTEPVVYARKLSYGKVDKQTKALFFNTNHIQGNAPSSFDVGLFDGDQLVACSSFLYGKSEIVLVRYATNKRVVGGFSKIVKNATIDMTLPIVSFADLRWSNGDVYKNNGWEMIKSIPPDYAYVKGNHRYHKFGYRHKYLNRKLNKYDASKSEHQNCKDNNIFRIWDCGKLKYEYTKHLE